MFIVSTKAYGVKLKDGTLYKIPRGFIGEIPAEVANSLIVKLAIKGGTISTPASTKDAVVEKAVEDGEKKAVEEQKAQEEKRDAKKKK